MRPKHDIVWRALMMGLEVKLNDWAWTIIDDELCYGLPDDKPCSWVVANGLEMNDFIKMSNKLSDEEATIIAMNTSLNRSKKQERKIRHQT